MIRFFFTVPALKGEAFQEVCKKLVKEKDIHLVLLCPGFTHRDVVEISEAVRENVGVVVARGDGSSNRVSMEVMKREG